VESIGTTRASYSQRHFFSSSYLLILLLAPPFDRGTQDPGYIKAYPPGIRENGGQYTHGAVWIVMALARLGSGDEATWEGPLGPLVRLGPAHMDGETALAYSRIRLDSDLKRIQRQHQVMRAVMDKVMSLQLLTKTFSLWREYQDTIDTDLPDWEVPGLALLALRVGSERVTTYSLEEAVQPAVGNGGASILLAKQDKVQAILKKVFYDPRLRREGATVQVLDSSGDPQRSARFSAYLASQGLSEGRVINGGLDLPLSGSETTIFNLTDKKYTARSLAQWLNLPDGRVKGRNAAVAEAIPTGVDILLVLGPDAKVP